MCTVQCKWLENIIYKHIVHLSVARVRSFLFRLSRAKVGVTVTPFITVHILWCALSLHINNIYLLNCMPIEIQLNIFLFFLFFCLRGRFPSLLRDFLHYSQWSCSASGSLWKMPDSNMRPLPQKSGALAMCHHISMSHHISYEPPHLQWATTSLNTALWQSYPIKWVRFLKIVFCTGSQVNLLCGFLISMRWAGKARKAVRCFQNIILLRSAYHL